MPRRKPVTSTREDLIDLVKSYNDGASIGWDTPDCVLRFKNRAIKYGKYFKLFEDIFIKSGQHPFDSADDEDVFLQDLRRLHELWESGDWRRYKPAIKYACTGTVLTMIDMLE